MFTVIGTVRVMTTRTVKTESATGSTHSERIKMDLTLSVEKVCEMACSSMTCRLCITVRDRLFTFLDVMPLKINMLGYVNHHHIGYWSVSCIDGTVSHIRCCVEYAHYPE